MSFLDEIKQTTANAQDRLEQERRATERKHRARMLAEEQAKQARIEQMTIAAKTTVAEEVRELIRAEAAKGQRTASYRLQLWAEDYLTEYARITSAVLREVFTAEGFTTGLTQTENRPCGSDSTFDTTVYTVDFDISW
jgi:hypothetical protein